jgi:hypothetical protein
VFAYVVVELAVYELLLFDVSSLPLTSGISVISAIPV